MAVILSSVNSSYCMFLDVDNDTRKSGPKTLLNPCIEFGRPAMIITKNNQSMLSLMLAKTHTTHLSTVDNNLRELPMLISWSLNHGFKM